MKSTRVMIAAVLLATLPSTSALAADTRGFCEFKMSLEVPAREKAGVKIPGRTMLVNGKAWQAGDRARIDTYANGRTTGSSVIVAPDAIYTLQNSRKQAMKKPMTPQLREKMFGGFPLLFLSAVDPAKRWKDAAKVGTDKIDGTLCDIWKVKLPSGPNQIASIWIPRSTGGSYPLRAVITVPTPQYANGKLSNDGPALKCTVSASNVQHGYKVDEARFALPAGYAIQIADSTTP